MSIVVFEYIVQMKMVLKSNFGYSLKNFGNTCYVNATLQVLFALPGFTDDLVSAFKQVEDLPYFSGLFAQIIAARKTGLSHAVNVSTQ